MGLEKKYEYEGNKYISIGIESDAIKENASEVLDNVLNHYTNNIGKLIYMAKIFTKNSAESSINISIVNGDNIEYLVSLKNNELVSYYSGKFKNNEKISEISFNEDSGYNFRVYDKENALKIVKNEKTGQSACKRCRFDYLR